MNNVYYMVGPYEIHDANLVSGDFVAGLPSPFSALGLVGSICRKYIGDGWSYAVIPLFHSVEISSGRLRGAPERGTKNALQNVEIVETVQGNMTVSFLMEFPDYVSVSNIARQIEKSRFSGGSIFLRRQSSFEKTIHPIETDDLNSILKLIPRGYALTPPSQKREGVNKISFGEWDSLEEVITRAYPGDPLKGSGMIVPCPVGYRLCEDPYAAKPRKGTRSQDIPHVFVDQAVGLGELISLRNKEYFSSTQDVFQTLAWRWSKDETSRFVMFSPFHLKALGLNT